MSIANTLNLIPKFESVEVDSASCIYKIEQTEGTIPSGGDGYCLGNENWQNQSDCHAQYEILLEGVEDVCKRNGTEITGVFEEDCHSGIWIDDDKQLQLQHLAYTRTIEGLQWLWGKADSPGTNHMFGTYKIAVNIGEGILENYKTINDDFYGAIDGIKNKLSSLSQSGGSADGVSSILAIAGLYKSLSDKDDSLSEFYENLSGYEEFSDTYSDDLDEVFDEHHGRIDSSKYEFEVKKGGSFFHLLRELNSYKGYFNSDKEKHHGTGRYNLAQGRQGCGFGGRRIWREKNKFCNRNTNYGSKSNKYPNCDGWGSPWDTIRDGDCVKEGWRLDDPSGGFFGSPSGGGLLDAIYPSSLKSSSTNLFFQKLKNKNIFDIINTTIAGTNRTEIGYDPEPIDSANLRARILRDWTAFSSEEVSMEGTCNGGMRNQVVPNLGVDELFLLEKLNDPNVTKEDWYSVPGNRSTKKREEQYHQIVSNLLLNILSIFTIMAHQVGKIRLKGLIIILKKNQALEKIKKKTYRYFRDGMNYGEYDTTIDLINAAIWLGEYHSSLKEMNESISNCLIENAESLAESLNSNESSSTDDTLFNSKFIGDQSETYVNCDGGGGAGTTPSRGDLSDRPWYSVWNC